MATVGNERHLRYILLLGEGGNLVLREILTRETQKEGKSLEVLLNANKSSIQRILDRQLLHKVYPSGGVLDVTSWDISLLAKIILQLFKKNLTGDECSAVRNLKDLRNELAHASSLSMEENEYDDDRKELAATLIKLSNGLSPAVHDKCQNLIKDSATGPIDIHAATERVKELSKHDNIISEELRMLTGKVEEVSRTILRNSQMLQEVKSMLEEMGLTGMTHFHSFPVLGTDMAIRGSNDDLTNLAEETVVGIFDIALERTGGDTDTRTFTNAVRSILEDIRKCNAVDVCSIEKRCIRINIKSKSCRGLLQLLRYLEGDVFQKRLRDLELALDQRFGGIFRVTAAITNNSLTEIKSILTEGKSALTQFPQKGGHSVTDEKFIDVCAYCAAEGKLQPATYFCRDCSLFGRYICDGPCLKHHMFLPDIHNVVSIGEKSKRKRLQDEIAEERKQSIAKGEETEKYRLLLDKSNKTLEEEIYNRLKLRESMQHKNDFKLVASIDIGTTHSGYAYSFKHDYQADPSKVSTNQKWVAGSMSVLSLKAPTAVLFDENQQFHSFGYEAENTYSELALDGEHHNWYFFKRFKMRLHDKNVAWVTEIYDDNGRKAMNIIDVFGAVINYLKERLLEQLKHSATEVQNQNIHWVLTVPAIWSDSAKQFMRESAYKAGIDDRRLSIASEPEAASLFCQMLPSEKIKGTEGARFDVASPGTKHMVIDLGGGTVDITVLERQADGDLKQLHKASGGAWGGTKVDEEFYQLLIRIIGGPLYQKFIDENIPDHLDLQRELETKKRTINPQSSGKITIKVPVALLKMYEDDTEETVKEAIEATPYTGKITWSSDKMRIDAQVFKNLFRPCTDRIVSYIKDLLKQPDFQGTNIFVMVGGFSESVIIQDAIMKALPMGKVIIPAEAELAVLKGAVIFGHRALAISSGATGAKW